MGLPRVHAFEFNDRHWVPAVLRDTIVESLSRTLEWGGILDGLAEPLGDFLERAGQPDVLDIGSGAGGPASILARALSSRGRPTRILLTDLFPRIELWELRRAAHREQIEFVAQPVDATAIPPEIAGRRARVIINVLHHLDEPVARGVLTDARRARAPIFVAEGFARNPLGFLPFAPVGVLALSLSPLLARDDRWLRAWLVWASPVALLASVWDGVVSTLRVYEPDELRRMVDDDPSYEWSHGTYRFPFGGRGTFFRGIPREQIVARER
jgi:hypothetical protein